MKQTLTKLKKHINYVINNKTPTIFNHLKKTITLSITILSTKTSYNLKLTQINKI